MPLDTLIINFVMLLQTYSTELISLLLTIVCGVSILVLYKNFGKVGLITFNAMAVIVGNIQVLRVAEFGFSPDPVALGTVMFAATFMVTDVLNECYGRAVARFSIFLSFTIYVSMTLCMLVDLGHRPQPGDVNYAAMETLFTPSLRFFIASLSAFLLSQLLDIWIFNRVKNLCEGRFLWLRTNASTFISGLVDNFIFSTLAWVILSPSPVSFHTLMMTYVIGSYLYRAIVNVILTPVIYECKRIFLESQEYKPENALKTAPQT